MSQWTKIVVEENDPRIAKQAADQLIDGLLGAIHRSGKIDGVEAYMMQGDSACHVYWFSPGAIDLLQRAGAPALPPVAVASDSRPDLSGFTRIPL